MDDDDNNNNKDDDDGDDDVLIIILILILLIIIANISLHYLLPGPIVELVFTVYIPLTLPFPTLYYPAQLTSRLSTRFIALKHCTIQYF